MSILTRIIRINPLKSSIYKNIQCLHTQYIQSHVCNVTNVPLINSWIWQHQNNCVLPRVSKEIVKLPTGIMWAPFIERDTFTAVDEPTNTDNNHIKQAARLIIIRRKKMKKHKLKKLRKRMKFEWAKLRQKRELRKEKEFQAELIQKCKVADNFSAETYVEERLAKYNEFIIPKLWKGRRYPEFIIRQKMGLPPKK